MGHLIKRPESYSRRKEKKGAALGYLPEWGAPRVLAVARGYMVESLLRLAEKYNISVYRDPDLSEALSALEPGNEIPEELFKAVAQVLAYCYSVNADLKEKAARSGI
jgi:flagellar biosynthesis protein